MSIQVPVPLTAYKDLEISLGGISYTFSYRFNSRFKKYEDDLGTWVIDILDVDNNYLIKNLAVVGQGYLMEDLLVKGFEHGDILCLKNKSTDAAPTRDNLGIDKEYILLYRTNEEIQDARS